METAGRTRLVILTTKDVKSAPKLLPQCFLTTFQSKWSKQVSQEGCEPVLPYQFTSGMNLGGELSIS